MPLKQNGILKHIKKNKVCIIGVLETKLTQQSLEGMLRKKFKFWKSENNFELNPHGRILILWKEDKATLEIMEKSDQVIHCLVTRKSSSIKFHLSFVYAFNTIVGRRPLWDNLRRFGSDCVGPWMILGDFNNVLSNDEKVNGLPVSSYATRDFRNCCYDTDMSDMSSSGVFYTWSNNSIWCKLDRAMINRKWVLDGLIAQARYDFPGKLSDHSPCTVTLFDDNDRGATPFKNFFTCGPNMISFWRQLIMLGVCI